MEWKNLLKEAEEEGEQKWLMFLLLQPAAAMGRDPHLNYTKPRTPPNPINLRVWPEISAGDKGMLLMQQASFSQSQEVAAPLKVMSVIYLWVWLQEKKLHSFSATCKEDGVWVNA